MTSNDSSFDNLVLRLSRTRAESLDFVLPPWESKSESVRKCWDDLTSPQNIESIKRWADKAAEMNPAARVIALKALELCLSKSNDGMPPEK